MILTCPECATSYFIDDDRIPPVGRSVKCSSCGARWKALPDGEIAPASPPRPPAVSHPTPPEDLEITPLAPRRGRGAAKGKAKGPPVLAIGVGVMALVAAMAGAAAIFREQVAGMIPGSAPLYAAVGLPVNAVGLNFEGVAWKPAFAAGKPVMAVTGAIRNTTHHPVDSPPVRISLLDKAGKPLAEYQLNVTNARVPPGGLRHFAMNLPDPPAGMARFDIAFDIAAKAAPAHGPAHGPEPAPEHPPEPVDAKPLPADSPDALAHHE